jgi:hypothetical protein
MADSLNTPTLSKLHHSLSRRSAMKQLAAAVAATGIGSLPAIARDHPDQALFVAIAEWHHGQEEQQRIDKVHSQIEKLATETEPAVPRELFEALNMPDGNRLPSDEQRGWDAGSLQGYAETGQSFQGKSKTLPNGVHRSEVWWQDISSSTRMRAVELLEIRVAYDALVEKHWEEAEDWQDRYGDQVSVQFDKMMEIAQMPVLTGDGLLAKCQLLLSEPIFCDMFGDMGDECGIITKALIVDIQAIAPVAIAIGPSENGNV